jgi:hypothetical protein
MTKNTDSGIDLAIHDHHHLDATKTFVSECLPPQQQDLNPWSQGYKSCLIKEQEVFTKDVKSELNNTERAKFTNILITSEILFLKFSPSQRWASMSHECFFMKIKNFLKKTSLYWLENTEPSQTWYHQNFYFIIFSSLAAGFKSLIPR